MFDSFSNLKKATTEKLVSLANKIAEYENTFSFDLSEVKQKIKNSLENLNSEIFSIALFGAFSDGKSSIIAGLLESPEIKIDVKPTTCDIEIYNFKDYQIVDTPGLFAGIIAHTEKTKKYISESQVIIFTLDPVNPINESQIPAIKWILNDLDKLSSTIFVINKMDEIANLEDNDDYNEKTEIKKQTILETLETNLQLDADKLSKINIISVAANPYDEGIKNWLNDLENYYRLSRLKHLKSIIIEFVEKSKSELLINSSISAIKDSIIQIKKQLIELENELLATIKISKNQIDELSGEISEFEKDVTQKYLFIKEEIHNLRTETLNYIGTATEPKDLQQLLQEKLGADGYVLIDKINDIIRKHTERLSESEKSLFKKIQESFNFHDSLFKKLTDKFGKTILSSLTSLLYGTPIRTIADGILKFRDFFNIPFKFKPWGALKFAKAIPILGSVLEGVLESFNVLSGFIFEKKKNKILETLDSVFKDFFEEFTSQKYLEDYFPNICKVKEVLKEIENSYEASLNQINETQKAFNELENIL